MTSEFPQYQQPIMKFQSMKIRITQNRDLTSCFHQVIINIAIMHYLGDNGRDHCLKEERSIDLKLR